jgi:hypothetical protein
VVSAQVILQRARIWRSRHNVEDVVSCVPPEAGAFQATGDHSSDTLVCARVIEEMR